MISQGLTLTLVGMSVVFLFLTLLVVLMKGLSAVLPKYFPDKEETKPASTGSANAEIAAAIAAVKAFTKS